MKLWLAILFLAIALCFALGFFAGQPQDRYGDKPLPPAGDRLKAWLDEPDLDVGCGCP